MNIQITDLNGRVVNERSVGFEVIATLKGSQAVFDTVLAYRSAQRSGTACTKNAGEVAGTNKKPWRQKGTGRARAGSFQSPLWRGGGVVFGPRPRDWSVKVNQKVKRLALRKAVSARLAAGDVVVLEELVISAPRTKEFLKAMDALKLGEQTVLVVASPNPNLRLASRNVPNVELTTGDDLNTYQVLRPAKLVFTREAFEKLEQRLARK
ncbi:MAG: 50S ribosomal protein L4 [Limisphaerales bacterium]